MARGRYIIDSTGNELTDSKTGEKIRIKEYKIKKSGKLQIVCIIDGSDKPREFARHSINEEKFNLGVVTPSKGDATLRDVQERVAVPPVPAPPQRGADVIDYTREEVLELHAHSKAIFDITHRAFMRTIVPARPSAGKGA